MALTAQPASHPQWGRWAPQVSPEYSMVDSHGMMVYGPRPGSPPEMMNSAGPFMPAQYMMPAQYSSPGVQTIAAPHYAEHQQYAAYAQHPHMVPAAPSPVQEYQAHPADGRVVLHTPGSIGTPTHDDDEKPFMRHGHLSPPMSRRGSEICPDQLEMAPTKNSKTITANETLDPKDRVEFDTDVDQLVRALQVEGDSDSSSQAFTPVASPKAEEMSARSSPVSSAGSLASNPPFKPRKYICNGPNCNKAFSQKTHLDIHKRTHTGKRPYTCKHEGCNLTFSQLGNLKTHERRHTGERPYKCSKCDKTFAQKGNVKSHEETHEGKKPFHCILDGCDKKFSQLGNMKTHQNNFHKKSLLDLTSKFVKFSADGYVPEEYRVVFDYFKLHYKNSNKGIKGRGKARKIAGKDTQSAPRKATKSEPSSPRSSRNKGRQEPTSYTVVNGPGAMDGSVPRTSPGGPFAGFTMVDQGAGAPHMFYEDEQARQMAFTERFY